MAISQALINAQKQLEIIRERDGVQPRPSTPGPERVVIAPPSPQPQKPEPKETAVSPFQEALAAAPAYVVEKYKELKRVAGPMATLPPSPALQIALKKLENKIVAGDYSDYYTGASVRIFGRMMARAQLLRHELDFRLWMSIRWLDEPGRGSVDIEAVKATFSDGGRYAFTSWANLRRQINRAIDRGYLWYSKDKTRIFYAAEARTAVQILGLESVGGWALEIPISELTINNKAYVQLRAMFHDAFHAGRGDGYGRPISKRSTQEETGRGKRTQRKYEQLAGTKRLENFEFLRWYSPRAYAITKKVERQAGERKTPARVIGAGRNKRIVRQLPNSYQGNFATAKRGRRWLNHRIKNLRNNLQSDGETAVSFVGSFGSKIQPKRYYQSRDKMPPDAAGYHPLESKYSRPGLWCFSS